MLSHLYIIVPDNQTMNKIDGSTFFKIATKYPITWWTVIWMTTWYYFCAIFCSVFLHLLFSHSVVSDFLRLRGLQHIRLPCPSPSPRACTNTGPLSWWCHPTTSSSLVPFSYLQSFPASGSFLMTALWIRWSKYWSFSFSISLPMNFQNWFPLRLTGLISLQSKGFTRVFSYTTVQKHQLFVAQPSLWSNSDIHTWLLEKP